MEVLANTMVVTLQNICIKSVSIHLEFTLLYVDYMSIKVKKTQQRSQRRFSGTHLGSIIKHNSIQTLARQFADSN